jgi:hypothetical protein
MVLMLVIGGIVKFAHKSRKSLALGSLINGQLALLMQ